jgi:hypothetical protein
MAGKRGGFDALWDLAGFIFDAESQRRGGAERESEDERLRMARDTIWLKWNDACNKVY